MPTSHEGESLPNLIVSAPHTGVNSVTSSDAETIAGDAPADNATFAAIPIAT